tara:strand:- start:1226 stop:1408 length:183 start_codon:yes stop_codon:yes gene_type:complete
MKIERKEVNLNGPYHKKYNMRLEKLEIKSGTYYTLYKNGTSILKLDQKDLVKLKLLLGSL